MKPRRLVLFSGMGADGRLFRSIRIPEAEIVTPDHAEPAPGETLPQYAVRIADRLNIEPADFVGGISFGGMLAGEIAQQRRVAEIGRAQSELQSHVNLVCRLLLEKK